MVFALHPTPVTQLFIRPCSKNEKGTPERSEDTLIKSVKKTMGIV